MATKITQLEDLERDMIVLRVEGELSLTDATLLQRISCDLMEESNSRVSIDLSDLGFLDSEAAPIIRAMEQVDGLEIEGISFFVQKVITETENKAS